MYVKFTEFYAPYWNTQPWNLYPAVRKSRTGLSWWIKKDGRVICVPDDCVERLV